MAVPHEHRTFLDNAVARLKTDERLLGVAVGGSWNTDEMDRFSDLDLVIAVADEGFDTGEHVGERRIFIR